jgi:hypothetical protein
MMLIIIVVTVISIPIMLGFPAVISPVPPLVILIPATLPFSIQIPPPFLGLVAALAMFFDGFVQSCFRLFNRVLALRSVIVSLRPRCCDKKPERPRHYSCHCCLS